MYGTWTLICLAFMYDRLIFQKDSLGNRTMLKFAMYFAMFVGAIVIAAWVSREASYFFNNLFYYVRYHWLPFLGGVALIAIIYKILSSKS